MASLSVPVRFHNRPPNPLRSCERSGLFTPWGFHDAMTALLFKLSGYGPVTTLAFLVCFVLLDAAGVPIGTPTSAHL